MRKTSLCKVMAWIILIGACLALLVAVFFGINTVIDGSGFGLVGILAGSAFGGMVLASIMFALEEIADYLHKIANNDRS